MPGLGLAQEISYWNPLPYRPYWSFDSRGYHSIWTTVQVPVDIAATTMEIFIWSQRLDDSRYTQAMRWAFDAQIAGRAGLGIGALIGNQTGAATVSYMPQTETATSYYRTEDGERRISYRVTYSINWRYIQRDSLGTITVNPGDIVHTEIYRDVAHADDTSGHPGALFMVDFEYTADS